MHADIFEKEGALKELKGKMDTVQIGLVLHLEDLEVQTRACEQIVGLLKREKGCFGLWGSRLVLLSRC
jgi:hypothetical protein